MEDDHVDRPGVEVRQRMKLTGTNSSIGLIIHILHTHPGSASLAHAATCSPSDCGSCAGAMHERQLSVDGSGFARNRVSIAIMHSFSNLHAFRRPGGSGGVIAPGPIPNTAVKRPSADGTSSQDAGE